MADNQTPQREEIQYPLWRGINGLIAAILTGLVMWSGLSTVQAREDIVKINSELIYVRRDLDRVANAVERLQETLSRGRQ